jgi:hypothetical protein
MWCEAIKRDEDHTQSNVAILDEVDRVNSQHARGIRNHWTHARDPPTGRFLDVYNEGDSCSFLALSIQARLVKYARAKLIECPSNMRKRGRPLLDYALRPKRTTPIGMPYHSLRDDPSVDLEMVRLLLDNGADPNQRMYLNNGKTVRALFLLSCHETRSPSRPHNDGSIGYNTRYGVIVQASLSKAWLLACELLISHGARWDCRLTEGKPELTVSSVPQGLFGVLQTKRLERLLEEKAKEMQRSGRACVLM